MRRSCAVVCLISRGSVKKCSLKWIQVPWHYRGFPDLLLAPSPADRDSRFASSNSAMRPCSRNTQSISVHKGHEIRFEENLFAMSRNTRKFSPLLDKRELRKCCSGILGTMSGYYDNIEVVPPFPSSLFRVMVLSKL